MALAERRPAATAADLASLIAQAQHRQVQRFRRPDDVRERRLLGLPALPGLDAAAAGDHVTGWQCGLAFTEPAQLVHVPGCMRLQSTRSTRSLEA